MKSMKTRCGFVAIVGLPNVGKSTLVNALAGEKVSIVSRRKQTTRGVIRAVCEHRQAQIILLDSPGWQTRHDGDFNRRLNGGAQWAATSSDVAVFMLTPFLTAEDADFLSRLPPNTPFIAAINKIDLLKNKRDLLPVIDDLRRCRDFAAIVPLSARQSTGVAELADEIVANLPASPALFTDGDLQDRDFLLGELLREKIFRMLDDELPYCAGVEAFSVNKNGVLHVSADIYVERDSQKAIVIGDGGAMLKKLSTAARRDMERACGGKVFLRARVVARAGWRQNARLLSRMRIGAPS